MNRPHLSCLALLITSALLAGAVAQEKKPSKKPKDAAAEPAEAAELKPVEKDPFAADLHVIAEFIEVEHEAFSDWLLENSLKADATELRREVQRWVKEALATHGG